MKIEIDYNQYMAMLKAFTEYAQCKAECYRLKRTKRTLLFIMRHSAVQGCWIPCRNTATMNTRQRKAICFFLTSV